jgi:hypothetical protein
MTQEMQTKLSSILNWIETTAKTAETFAAEQTPLYIQELLAWNFWYSLIYWIILGIIPLIAAALLVRLAYKEIHKPDSNADIFGPLCGGVLIATTIGAFGFFCNLEWIQIWIAPRVWLLEYAAGVIGRVS